MDRTYVVTGSASGIGAATAQYLRERGGRVIGCDLHNADVIADLAIAEGRAALVDSVKKLSGGSIDGVVANAGGGPGRTTISLNFFGAVGTLDGLRPLLANSYAPRAVAVSSIASLSPILPALVDACLSMDEARANAVAMEFATKVAPLDKLTPEQQVQVGVGLYGNAKYSLNCWCRRVAVQPDWAGAGINLNVVGPGLIDTPAAQYILTDPERRAGMKEMVPMGKVYPARPVQMAAILAWLVSEENSLMTGQILFADGGFECQQRGERSW